jgi:hypothetical protein
MFKSILNILSFLTNLFSLEAIRAKKKIKQDKKLADAIKGSDGKLLAALKKIRDAGKGPTSVLLVCLFIQSCSLLPVSTSDVPLTEGEIPFKLPPGDYPDVEGEVHKVGDERWSISEEDLFQGVLKDEAPSNPWKIASLISGLVALGAGAGLLVKKRK